MSVVVLVVVVVVLVLVVVVVVLVVVATTMQRHLVRVREHTGQHFACMRKRTPAMKTRKSHSGISYQKSQVIGYSETLVLIVVVVSKYHENKKPTQRHQLSKVSSHWL